MVLGDTTADDNGVMRLSNEEIEAYAPGGLLEQSTNLGAAASLADLLANRYAGYVNSSEGQYSAELSQLSVQYRALATRLRSRSISMTYPATGYCSPSPAFTRKMGDPTWNAPPESDYC